MQRSKVFSLFVLGALLSTLALAGCATTGDDSDALICHAADGSMVSIDDDRCPPSVRNSLKTSTPAPLSIPQSMANQDYDAENGLSPGDFGYRPY